MAINNTLKINGSVKPSASLNLGIQPNSMLSGSALSNALAKGLGSGIAINPTGGIASPRISSASKPAISAPVTAPRPSQTPTVSPQTVSPPSQSSGINTDNFLRAEETPDQWRVRVQGANTPGLLTPPSAPTSSGTAPLVPPTPQKPTLSGLVTSLAAKGGGPSSAFDSAQKAYERALIEQEKIKNKVQETKKDIYSDDSSFRIMQGRDQALQNQYAAELQSAAERTTQTQNLVTQAQRQQELEQAALTSAAGFAQPSLGQYGQTYYDPLNPGSSGGASGITGGWASYLSGGGDPSQIPSAVRDNPVLWQQTLNAAKQQNPGFDVNSALGAAQGRQSNASTAGSAVINTAAQGYQTTTQAYNQMTAANNAAHAQSQTLMNTLKRTGINANDPTLFNKALNKISKFTSSPDYAAFATDLTELQNVYSQLLQTGGGTPTGNEQQSLNVLNPESSAAAIASAIGQLEQAAYNKLNAQYQQANSYLQQLQGGGQAPVSNNNVGGQTITTAIGNFVKDANGKWVPAR